MSVNAESAESFFVEFKSETIQSSAIAGKAWIALSGPPGSFLGALGSMRQIIRRDDF